MLLVCAAVQSLSRPDSAHQPSTEPVTQQTGGELFGVAGLADNRQGAAAGGSEAEAGVPVRVRKKDLRSWAPWPETPQKITWGAEAPHPPLGLLAPCGCAPTSGPAWAL